VGILGEIMKCLYLLLIVLLLSSCATREKPAELKTEYLPSADALVKLKFSISNKKAISSLAIKHDFVAPKIELGDAQELLAYKENTQPIVIKRADMANYDGYRLEPIQTLNAFGDFEQDHLNLLFAEQLWQYSFGDNTTIAVIDSGIDKNHPSLKSAYAGGYNFVSNNSTPIDESGHGTAIAAIIAGRGPQYGIAPKAKILALKVLDKNNQGSNYDVTRAILYAADLLEDMPNPNKADIINLSLGSYSYSPAMHDAIKRATAKGIVIIAAAGNSARNKIAYPAALPEVISVGAAQLVYNDWSLMPYSNYGKYADILAPMGGYAQTNQGVYAEAGILTAAAFGSSTRVHGTSFAAAEVSGVVALMNSLGIKPEKLKQILLATAVDIDKIGWDERTAYGILSPLAALKVAKLADNTEDIVLRFLDGASQQEISRASLSQKITTSVTPGKYKIFAFADHNHDNLWQDSEPFYYSDIVQLQGHRVYEKDIVLKLP